MSSSLPDDLTDPVAGLPRIELLGAGVEVRLDSADEAAAEDEALALAALTFPLLLPCRFDMVDTHGLDGCGGTATVTSAFAQMGFRLRHG